MLADPRTLIHRSIPRPSPLSAPGTLFPDWPARMASPAAPTFSEAHRAFEVQFITDALRKNDGNITRTARAIGMTRRNLQVKIQKLGIDVNALRSRGGTRNE